MMSLFRPQPADSWHELKNTALPAEAVEQDWELGEAPYIGEIRAAILRWKRGAGWPELSDGARYFLRIRLNAACDFVYMTPEWMWCSGGNVRDLAARFLLEWWPEPGRRYFAKMISAEDERTWEEDEEEE